MMRSALVALCILVPVYLLLWVAYDGPIWLARWRERKRGK